MSLFNQSRAIMTFFQIGHTKYVSNIFIFYLDSNVAPKKRVFRKAGQAALKQEEKLSSESTNTDILGDILKMQEGLIPLKPRVIQNQTVEIGHVEVPMPKEDESVDKSPSFKQIKFEGNFLKTRLFELHLIKCSFMNDF